MKRYELLHRITDAAQAAAFIENWGYVCKVKANGENKKTWCNSYPMGAKGCEMCKIDYWNEEVPDDRR